MKNTSGEKRRAASTAIVVSVAALSLGVLGQGCSAQETRSGFTGDDNPSTSSSDGGGGGPTLVGGGDAGTRSGVLDAGCATATASTSRAPVYMLIVLDASGSMGADNKWSAVVPALDAIFDQLLAQRDSSFAVGLNVFSDSLDPSCSSGPPCEGPYPTPRDVRIAAVDQAQHDALRGRIDATVYMGNTPTFAALTGGYAELEGFVPSGGLAGGGKKVLVLMTDGVPDGATDEQWQCTAAATAELAKTGPAGPITTFAVGVGPFPSPDTTGMSGYDPGFMGALAQAGGTAPAGCNPAEQQDPSSVCYFQVTPGSKPVQALTQDFIDAINKIRGQVSSCDFVLDKSGGAVDPSQVNVVYTDGSGAQHVLAQDAQNGWTYDVPNDPSRVTLHGAACDQVRNDASGKVSIVLGCKTVTK